METQNTAYDFSFYNLLPSIEAADEAMRRHNKLQLAEQILAPIFAKYDMSPQWGVALLHRHWWLENGELPVQSITRKESPKEYETSPHRINEKTAWPSLMAVGIDPRVPLIPLEFSSDEVVRKAHMELHEKAGFVLELQAEMISYHLEKTFGLVFTRDVTHNKYELVEFNSEKRASVLKESTKDELLDFDTIQTSWRFHLDGSGTTCKSSCWSRCVIPSGGGSHRHEHPKPHQP